MNAQEQIEYYRRRILFLMAEVEEKHNRYNRKEIFECTFPTETEEAWNAIDTKDLRKLRIVTEKLNKLSDSF